MKQLRRILGRIAAPGAALGTVLAVAPAAHAEPKTHDGFYFQGAAGLGYLSSSAEALGQKISYSGVTTPLSLLFGGTVGPVAIGGGFFFDHAASPSGSLNGGTKVELQDLTMTLIGLGVFADYYLDPHEGLHFQPFLGWGGLESSYKGNSGGSDPTGMVLGLGAGYDWWVGDEWSIGVMGRLAFAPLSRDSVSFTTIAPALLATFTYH